MKKHVILFAIMIIAASAQAEWFLVKSVESYNQITAVRSNDASDSAIKIRINNLENIEDIQVNRAKVLFSGKSAHDLAKSLLEGQLVRIENLREDSGIYVGDVYLSYEKVVRGFAKQRMVGGQTISPELKSTINKIYGRMLKSLDSATIGAADNLLIEGQKKASDSNTRFSFDSYYTDEYLKGIFVYEALSWFKDNGQFMPDEIQKLYIGWLYQYQSTQDQRAHVLEVKIRDMTCRSDLYRDFIFD